MLLPNILQQKSAYFSYKGTSKYLSFVSCMVFVTTTQLCCCSIKVIDNTKVLQENLIYKNRWGWIWPTDPSLLVYSLSAQRDTKQKLFT